jgi:hypothetical protein
MSRVLSERAKKRLKIAAGLLRGSGRRPRNLELSRERFYEDLQALINALPPDERLALKECTDWVEAYDNESERHTELADMKRKATS